MEGFEELRRRAALLATIKRISYEEALLRVAQGAGVRVVNGRLTLPGGQGVAPILPLVRPPQDDEGS